MRQTGALQRHRVSMAGTTYFVTCCTRHRAGGLLKETIAPALLSSIQGSDVAGDTTTVGFTIMTDHCHWLFELGGRLSLGHTLAKFKACTRRTLEPYGLGWQRNYFEHRLRPGDSLEDYALYIFLNPYRAHLARIDEPWQYWWSACPQRLRFVSHLGGKGEPPAPWLDLPDPKIAHGEGERA